jgi:hypothetical protein
MQLSSENVFLRATVWLGIFTFAGGHRLDIDKLSLEAKVFGYLIIRGRAITGG